MAVTIILGIGNRLGGDDAAGTHVVDILNQRLHKTKTLSPANIIAIDAGTVPENYSSVIRQHRPDLLLLIDAADMGLLPGTLRIIPPEKISALSFSTHSMPLSLFISYVKEFCRKVVLVGIQPERTEISCGISKVVRQSVKRLAEVILEGRIDEIPRLE